MIESSDDRLIGYERKKLSDLIASMKDRRLAGHQIQGMRKIYDRVELIIEGYWRPNPDTGALETMQRGQWAPVYHQSEGISYRQLDSYLYSLCEKAGVVSWRTGSTADTAHLYASRYHWWRKDYDAHRSHDALYTNDPSAQRRGAVMVMNGDPSPVVLLAAQIPGIDSKAWDVGKHFRSPYDMVSADVDEWRTVHWTDRSGKSKRFGKESCKKIVDWLRNR